MKTRPTSSHYRIVHTLYDCPLQGSLGNLMLEGGLQQFVALQLNTFVHPTPVTASLNRRDRDVMHAVKEYLHSTFQENHSLLELSRHFGISQSKLKKAFKELFGVPVIEYLYDLKMQHAKGLLYDQLMNVGEVSSMVGYKNANHFATAFKRKFGVNPSKV
jgi:AraC family transcriptional activator of pyochelin receptor